MSHSNAPQTSSGRMRATSTGWGVVCKVALGVVAVGTVVFAAGICPMILLALLFIDYEPAVTEIMSALGAVLWTGLLLLTCSLITLFLQGALFGWADVAGWAKLRCGWINRLSVALIVVGVIGMVRSFRSMTWPERSPSRG